MVVTFPATQSSGGIRPINPNKDFPRLVELLRLVFGQEITGSGPLLGNLPGDQNPSVLWRFDPNLARLSPGFIWEMDDKIVGNVTLLPTRPAGRFLVANVAVHPDYRRRGYARLLMNAVVHDVQERRGRDILLQVERDNDRAIALYRSMGFESLGSMTQWQSSVSRIHEVPENQQLIKVRALPSKLWREAYQLDSRALEPNLSWPEPRPPDYFKAGLWRRFFGYMNGQYIRTYVTFDDNSQLSGLATVYSQWGQPHQLSVRVLPSLHGQLELPLLNKAIGQVRNLARRNIRMIHNADDGVMNQLLSAANFRQQRTLNHMRLELK